MNHVPSEHVFRRGRTRERVPMKRRDTVGIAGGLIRSQDILLHSGIEHCPIGESKGQALGDRVVHLDVVRNDIGGNTTFNKPVTCPGRLGKVCSRQVETVSVIVRPLRDVDRAQSTHNDGLFLGESGGILGSRPGSKGTEGKEGSGTFRDRFHFGGWGRVKRLVRDIIVARASSIYNRLLR